MDNDSIPVVGLDELDKHLDDLVSDPNLPLNAKLFDDVELQLTDSNIPPLIPRFLPKLTAILQQYTQGDPAVLASLTTKLLKPVSFTQVLSLASEESLIEALNSPAPSANLLSLTVLHKAAATPADAAILSSMTGLVAAFIRCWLAVPAVEVGQKGCRVLGDLLDIDCPLPPPPPQSSTISGGTTMELVLRKSPGTGRMWQRILGDQSIYTLLLSICVGRHPDTSGNPKQLSLAQGRLLGVLPRLAALNFQAVTTSHVTVSGVTPVHATNGHAGGHSSSSQSRGGGGGGLLQFAALEMVDKRDVLMHLSLVDFFEAFISLMRVTEYSSQKVEMIRTIVREALQQDEGGMLKGALLSLPDRTVPDEADELRRWLREIMPTEMTVTLR
ncbi:hypothetical protein QBC46DRAFT_43188 [Diplogelasinospora grovesii]|uniref:DNA mismatch repair protein HSM3 N-terminal domain-containing protein n=1 Tax=Diplogelasinospora grovesii TaxID=303347 RepID=A0AAN6NDI1_9PEZI|nr:hypothetical protein QBC46DRAFT_43188 [Diplogelasinospora grovesii]